MLQQTKIDEQLDRLKRVQRMFALDMMIAMRDTEYHSKKDVPHN